MLLQIHSVAEEEPGPEWARLFSRHWPSYREWFLCEGHRARPGYVSSVKMLRQHMPELVPAYERLVELAGGGDLEARFLSLYCPPPYMAGCSQAVWTDGDPLLVRNYDYAPSLFEGNLLRTCWLRPVLAMSDCLWGVLDGVNDAGLVASLTFGGRKVVGQGFGVPLVLRYVLEICGHVEEAIAVLQRLPVHMPYNVTLLDRRGAFATLYLSPDRPAITTRERVGVNHQEQVEWDDYARLARSEERKCFLEERLADPQETAASLQDRFLRPPLFHTQYEKAFGTLYTAVYRPAAAQIECRWPGHPVLRQSLQDFREGTRVVRLSGRSGFRRKTLS